MDEQQRQLIEAPGDVQKRSWLARRFATEQEALSTLAAVSLVLGVIGFTLVMYGVHLSQFQLWTHLLVS